MISLLWVDGRKVGGGGKEHLLVKRVERLPTEHVPSARAIGQTVRFACGKNNHHQKKRNHHHEQQRQQLEEKT